MRCYILCLTDQLTFYSGGTAISSLPLLNHWYILLSYTINKHYQFCICYSILKNHIWETFLCCTDMQLLAIINIKHGGNYSFLGDWSSVSFSKPLPTSLQTLQNSYNDKQTRIFWFHLCMLQITVTLFFPLIMLIIDSHGSLLTIFIFLYKTFNTSLHQILNWSVKKVFSSPHY